MGELIPFRRYLLPDDVIFCQRCHAPYRPAEQAEIRRDGDREEAVIRCPACGYEWTVARR